MSGIQITVPMVFTDYVALSRWPVTSGLSSLFYLGGSAEDSAVNHAPGSDVTANAPGANATIASDYIEFTGSATDANNQMVTTDPDNASQDVTIIAIGQAPDVQTNLVMIAGSFNALAGGVTLFATRAFATAGGAMFSAVFASSTAWKFLSARYSAASGNLVGSIGNDGSLTHVTTALGSERSVNTVGLRAGGSVSGGDSYSGKRRIACIAKYRRALSDTELDMVYSYCRSRFSGLGV